MRGARIWGTACALAALGCPSDAPSAEAVRQAVQANLTEQGLSAETIQCGGVRAGAAACEAVVDGTTIVMDAEVADVLTVRPRYPTLRVADVEPEVAAKLAGLGHAVADLHCEGTVWLARAGTTGRCLMTDDEGQTWEYLATFTGDGARHRATITAR